MFAYKNDYELIEIWKQKLLSDEKNLKTVELKSNKTRIKFEIDE